MKVLGESRCQPSDLLVVSASLGRKRLLKVSLDCSFNSMNMLALGTAGRDSHLNGAVHNLVLWGSSGFIAWAVRD